MQVLYKLFTGQEEGQDEKYFFEVWFGKRQTDLSNPLDTITYYVAFQDKAGFSDEYLEYNVDAVGCTLTLDNTPAVDV